MSDAKKHIIITNLFEFGGSNIHLKALVRYFGKENIVIILETESERQYLKNIIGDNEIIVKIRPRLHKYAYLNNSVFANLKELLRIIYSIITIKLLSFRYGGADINICSIAPEKYLYLLWVPYCKVFYILHSTAGNTCSAFTALTCNRMLNRHKMVITVSHANRRFICKNWGVSAKKDSFVKVVYNCLPDPPSYFNMETSAKTAQYIVTMGHVVDYKNPATWLAVARRVTDSHRNTIFIWLGNGPLLDEFISATQFSDRIRFLGFIKDTRKYLQMATIYYQPSIFETQGLGVIEAMANNLPCIASNTGGLPESVTHQYNGLLVGPTDIEEHVDAITLLLNDKNLQNLYGDNAYQRYMELFTYDSFEKNMELIYG